MLKKKTHKNFVFFSSIAHFVSKYISEVQVKSEAFLKKVFFYKNIKEEKKTNINSAFPSRTEIIAKYQHNVLLILRLREVRGHERLHPFSHPFNFPWMESSINNKKPKYNRIFVLSIAKMLTNLLAHFKTFQPFKQIRLIKSHDSENNHTDDHVVF